MYRTRSIPDPARQWRDFCRRGRRMAGVSAALWFGLLAALFRVAVPSAPVPRAAPVSLSWWPAESDPAAVRAAADIRALWSPAVFALPTPAGFSHVLRTERSRLTPPVAGDRPEPVYLDSARTAGAAVPVPDLVQPFTVPRAPPAASGDGVFPPRKAKTELPRLVFPEGWESRIFSGIELDFGAWTNAGWNARMEMRFDERGVPVSMLLAEPSGWPEVDRRLARSARGWRLLEPSAPREGAVAWRNPPPAAGAPRQGGAVP